MVYVVALQFYNDLPIDVNKIVFNHVFNTILTIAITVFTIYPPYSPCVKQLSF